MELDLLRNQRAIGPAFAGFAIASRGLWQALFVSAALMAACMVLSQALPDPGTPAAGTRERLSWRSLMSGFRFVFNARLLFATMALDLFAVLFGGATYLMPVFADKLGVGPKGLGWMIAAPGVGAILMALTQAHRAPFRRAGRAMLFAVAGFGVATIVFGLSTSFYLSLAMLF